MFRVAAREAGDSIKPGAPAPGSELENAIEPAKRATAQTSTRCRPLRGLAPVSTTRSWGWRPRLYAVARFAGFQLMLAPASRALRDPYTIVTTPMIRLSSKCECR